MKKCGKCKRILPISCFHKNGKRYKKPERRSYCKDCIRIHDKKTRHLYGWDKVRKWKKKNPVAAKAQEKLRKAVFFGKIKKPKACEVCNRVMEKKHIQGHHDDYSKPFKVKWVCPQCHTRLKNKEL